MKFFSWYLSLFLLQIFNTLVAQTSSEDVVYLKNGSMFRGTVIEQHADSMVKVLIAGGNIIAILQKDLDHIEFGTSADSKASMKRIAENISSAKKEGYYNITELGVLAGSNYSYYAPTSYAGFTIQTINGYRFNSHFLVGGGLGLDIIQVPMVQFFLDGRWEILDKRATPFLFLDGGYGFTIANEPDQEYQQVDYKGGATWGSGVGMRFNFRQEGSFLIGVGYKMDKRSEHIVSDWWPYDTHNEYTFNRLSIKIGLGF